MDDHHSSWLPDVDIRRTYKFKIICFEGLNSTKLVWPFKNLDRGVNDMPKTFWKDVPFIELKIRVSIRIHLGTMNLKIWPNLARYVTLVLFNVHWKKYFQIMLISTIKWRKQWMVKDYVYSEWKTIQLMIMEKQFKVCCKLNSFEHEIQFIIGSDTR